jgi:hypothetical protein
MYRRDQYTRFAQEWDTVVSVDEMDDTAFSALTVY